MGRERRFSIGGVAALVAMATAMLAVSPAMGSTDARETQSAALVCNPSIDRAVATEHPQRCTVLPPSASFSEGVNLAKLRWQHWGEGHATFQGVSKGFHLPFLHLRVRGYAYRLRPDRCGGDRLLYTRVRLRVEGRAYTVNPQACFGGN